MDRVKGLGKRLTDRVRVGVMVSVEGLGIMDRV
jgi:hypothetical protein